MLKFSPMKGEAAPSDLSLLRYPLLCSEKLDGIRCMVADKSWALKHINFQPKHKIYLDTAICAIALSSSGKPIPNFFVQRNLDHPYFVGCDGELKASEYFNETSSSIMSQGGEPSFTFNIFDTFLHPMVPFEQRITMLKAQATNLYFAIHPRRRDSVETTIVNQLLINNSTLLEEELEILLADGAEGAMIRDPDGPYKFGKSTIKEGWLLKIKSFIDAEASVISYTELLHNYNPAEKDELGYSNRTDHQAGKTRSGKLGALVVQDLLGGPVFQIGTGFNDAQRAVLWSQRDTLKGKIVKYKSAAHGIKTAPRHPVFIGFRHEEDMTE